jgi:hypothetical protein
VGRASLDLATLGLKVLANVCPGIAESRKSSQLRTRATISAWVVASPSAAVTRNETLLLGPMLGRLTPQAVRISLFQRNRLGRVSTKDSR